MPFQAHGQEVSLTDLIYGFMRMARNESHNAITFPISNNHTWDLFFYQVRKDLSAKYPGLENELGTVDWDAPWPHLPRIWNHLHWLSQCCGVIHGDRMVPVDLLSASLPKELFDEMFAIAQRQERMIEPIKVPA
ncbi:hypothetical protein KW791_03405 [Candidatus Parcubacteria bacterium]|nr:hypothetical protein [Candidatus Parcubacteria bacterium]